MSSRGSEWAKWDLHVHTPSSIINNYGPDDDATWEKFIADLENLPAEFRVLGVNDYLFVDGYTRLREAKRAGRLKNIETLLPVVELRVDKFGGTDGHLRRVNVHVLFDEGIDPKLIGRQFLSALIPSYALAAGGVRWSGVIDRESLQDLGEQIIATVPAGERKNFGSPLQEGFNNLTVPYEKIRAALDAHYFHDKTLTAVGKTEWAAVKWNDQSIADKKNLINSADIVFISSETPAACVKARDSLRDGGVNSKLLDCSDAHWFSTAADKDRVGKCYTWIKADPTFHGLRHALKEYDDRVFLGARPPKLEVIASNPARFAQRIRIRKAAGSTLEEKWFDCDLPLNSDLVAIIGNKGSGKSALSDTLGLLGDTRNFAEASFLSAHKFRQPKQNKAREFNAELVWEGGASSKANLGDQPSADRPELVKYLPQNFLEKLCNEVSTGEETAFDRELRATIFSHLEPANRLGKSSLDDLIAFKTAEVQQAISQLRSQLTIKNRQVLVLEGRATQKHRSALEADLKKIEEEIKAVEARKPQEVAAPVQTPEAIANSKQLDEFREKAKTLQEEIKAAKSLLAAQATTIELASKLQSRLANFRELYEDARREVAAACTTIGVDADAVLAATIDDGPVKLRHVDLQRDAEKTRGSLAAKEKGLADLILKGKELLARLKEPEQRRAQYLADLQTWTANREALVGNAETPGTLAFAQKQVGDLATLADLIAAAVEERRKTTQDVFSRLAGLVATYKSLYSPVQRFIDTNEVVRDRFKLSFSVSIIENGFAQRFFDIVNRQVTGSFCGVAEGDRVVREILSTAEFQTADGAVAFAERVLDHLLHDKRTGTAEAIDVATQLKKGRTLDELMNFLFGFSYLEPRYILRLGDKDLYQLSPGEKGLLLLIFYLLVDQTASPIVIDQPEENLDNHTIFSLLVPCIRAAKARRQVIIVTHNPNLAVVCDAEQVIAATLDTTAGNAVTYTAGSIENPIINAEIVRILEGTMPAFENRDGKYLRLT